MHRSQRDIRIVARVRIGRRAGVGDRRRVGIVPRRRCGHFNRNRRCRPAGQRSNGAIDRARADARHARAWRHRIQGEARGRERICQRHCGRRRRPIIEYRDVVSGTRPQRHGAHGRAHANIGRRGIDGNRAQRPIRGLIECLGNRHARGTRARTARTVHVGWISTPGKSVV